MKITENDRRRFQIKVSPYVHGDKCCWLWTGASSGKYGGFWFGGKQVKAHIFAYMMEHGKVPNGKIVMHSCDNMKCVCPSHLELGTQSKNLLDCVARGRHVTQTKPHLLAHGKRNGAYTQPESLPRGESHGMSRLNRQKVLMARGWSANGLSNKKIAKKLKVSAGTIDAVISGRTWRHV